MAKLCYFIMIFCTLALLISGCGKLTGNAVNVNHVENYENNYEKNYEKGIIIGAYFCPNEDCSKIIEDFISNANYSVHCAFFELEQENLIGIFAKKSHTLDVKIVIDSNNYNGQIKGNGVKTANSKQYMHNKFCIVDSSKVLTGSFNPTIKEANLNNNNIITVKSGLIASNYEDEFTELWNGVYSSGKKTKYKKIISDKIALENYFCPEDCSSEPSPDKNAEALHRIFDLIRNAKESVRVASFTFTHEAISDELIKADSRGINVTILTENRQKNVMGSQYQRAKDFGLKIKTDSNKYSMHHKFIVIDDKIVITGSPNFTLSGFNKNDENFLIIYDKIIASKFSKEFDNMYG
ncbi:DUF1669 domain-containing protein [Candidatus Woesearchaeota archaeon]|nr:DUF1669 domain-containing protein [Candidatus Woesearchaeota archaeon]